MHGRDRDRHKIASSVLYFAPVPRTGDVMMDEFFSFKETDGFRVKLWRGEYMCLLGFDVDAPEDDFVGFAVEYKEPKGNTFLNLRNRIAFDYGEPTKKAVTGGVKFPTTEAPLQMFRWVHFPYEPQDGIYIYRITKMHMPQDGKLVRGTMIDQPRRCGIRCGCPWCLRRTGGSPPSGCRGSRHSSSARRCPPGSACRS